MKPRTNTLVLPLAAALLAGLSPASRAAGTFISYADGGTLDVSAGNTIEFRVRGAKGGDGGYGIAGGFGGYYTGSFTVDTAGTLTFYLGQDGGDGADASTVGGTAGTATFGAGGAGGAGLRSVVTEDQEEEEEG